MKASDLTRLLAQASLPPDVLPEITSTDLLQLLNERAALLKALHLTLETEDPAVWDVVRSTIALVTAKLEKK